MKPPLVESRSNSLVRLVRSVRDGDDKMSLFIEGQKLIEEALASKLPLRRVLCRPSEEKVVRGLLAEHKQVHVPIVFLSEDVLHFVSDTDSPQGTIALADRPKSESALPTTEATQSLIVVAAGIQNPQNLGNILRTSEAAGVEELWTIKGTVDPFSPKVIRGSSGSIFRLPVRTRLAWEDTVTYLKAHDIQSVAATADGKVTYDQVDWKKSSALFLGSEASGFSTRQLEALSQTIRIPMKGRVESLNVGTAAAICLFEAVRQKGQ